MINFVCPFCRRSEQEVPVASEVDFGLWYVFTESENVYASCRDCAYFGGYLGETKSGRIMRCAGDNPLRLAPPLQQDEHIYWHMPPFHQDFQQWPYTVATA